MARAPGIAGSGGRRDRVRTHGDSRRRRTDNVRAGDPFGYGAPAASRETRFFVVAVARAGDGVRMPSAARSGGSAMRVAPPQLDFLGLGSAQFGAELSAR